MARSVASPRSDRDAGVLGAAPGAADAAANTEGTAGRAAAAVARRRGPRPRTVLAIASIGASVAFVDATIVNIAFPSIRESFLHETISSLSLVLHAYIHVFA